MLKTVTEKRHPEFDLAAAKKAFTLPRGKGQHWGQITGPYDAYFAEGLRDKQRLRIGPALPTDLFVMCKGEPPQPDLTKIGGRPYWDSKRPWPVDSAGKRLRFLAQFNFQDSQDLFPQLPGELLLLFVSSEKDWLSKPIHFEWSSGPVKRLSPVRRLLFTKTVFHGAIHRSADYPEAMESDSNGIVAASEIAILNGTKIGGRPHFIQSRYDDLDACAEESRENPFRPGEMMVSPARPSRRGFLCQLASIKPGSGVPYPLANVPEAIEDDAFFKEGNDIVFADMGTIYIYLNPDGTMWNEVEFY